MVSANTCFNGLACGSWGKGPETPLTKNLAHRGLPVKAAAPAWKTVCPSREQRRDMPACQAVCSSSGCSVLPGQGEQLQVAADRPSHCLPGGPVGAPRPPLREAAQADGALGATPSGPLLHHLQLVPCGLCRQSHQQHSPARLGCLPVRGHQGGDPRRGCARTVLGTSLHPLGSRSAPGEWEDSAHLSGLLRTSGSTAL